jgi:hypothetical protein
LVIAFAVALSARSVSICAGFAARDLPALSSALRLALCDGDHRKNRRHDGAMGDTVKLVCLYWIEAINPLPGCYRLSAAMSLLF